MDALWSSLYFPIPHDQGMRASITSSWRCYIFFPFYSFSDWRAASSTWPQEIVMKKKHDGERNERTGGGQIGTKRGSMNCSCAEECKGNDGPPCCRSVCTTYLVLITLKA